MYNTSLFSVLNSLSNGVTQYTIINQTRKLIFSLMGLICEILEFYFVVFTVLLPSSRVKSNYIGNLAYSKVVHSMGKVKA